MQAIETKWLAPTSNRPTRIKAVCSRGEITVPVTTGTTEEAHKAAAYALCSKFEEEDRKRHGQKDPDSVWMKQMVTGQLKNQNYVHVFVL